MPQPEPARPTGEQDRRAAAILASLARAEADVAAGRVVEGEVAGTKLREMIEAHRQGRATCSADTRELVVTAGRRTPSST